MLPVKVYEASVEAGTEEVIPVKKARKKAASRANGHKAVTAKGARAKGKPMKAAKRAARKVDPNKLDTFGFRLGTLKSRAAAMYASKRGATLGEVQDKIGGSTQFNLLGIVAKRGFKVKQSKEDGEGSRKVTRYQIIPK